LLALVRVAEQKRSDLAAGKLNGSPWNCCTKHVFIWSCRQQM